MDNATGYRLFGCSHQRHTLPFDKTVSVKQYMHHDLYLGPIHGGEEASKEKAAAVRQEGVPRRICDGSAYRTGNGTH